MKNVVIVGAGPAGITAAYELLKKSKEYNIVILEESNEIGGISRTVKHNGNRMDIGGHRFFSKNKEVTRFWEQFMPIQGKASFDDIKLNIFKQLSKDGPDPEKEDKVMLIRQRVSRIYYLKKFFDYPVSMKLQTFKNMGLIRTINAGTSYLISMVHKLDETCLENFYINRFGRVLYSMFFEGYTEKLWGRHPKEISADWGAQRVKGVSIVAVIKDMFFKVFPMSTDRKVETSLIEEFYYPKFGPGQFWETAASEVEKMGGRIYKNCKVNKIKVNLDKIKELQYEKEGQQFTMKADIIISSMPLKDLGESIEGDISEEILDIAKGLPYRDFVTVGLLVNKLNLKNQTNVKTLGNIVPDCWIYVQDVEVKLGRIQIFNNWSPYLLKDPENTVWIGLEYFCNENDDFWNMNDHECIKFAVNELINIGIINDASIVLDSHRECVKKAYPAYFDTYKDIDKLISYLNKINNLYCIGRNGQHRYNNMDHSMATSFEAVNNILSGRADKDNVWNVNVEKEYNEEKK